MKRPPSLMSASALDLSRLLRYSGAAAAGAFLLPPAMHAEIRHQAKLDGWVPKTCFANNYIWKHYEIREVHGTGDDEIYLDVNGDGEWDVAFATFPIFGSDDEVAKAFDQFSNTPEDTTVPGVYVLTPSTSDNYYLYSFAKGTLIDGTCLRGNESAPNGGNVRSRGFVEEKLVGLNHMADENIPSGETSYTMNQYDPTDGTDYVGFEIYDGKDSHFGWVQVEITGLGETVEMKVVDYAWETTPNKPIVAGSLEVEEQHCSSATSETLEASTLSSPGSAADQQESTCLEGEIRQPNE